MTLTLLDLPTTPRSLEESFGERLRACVPLGSRAWPSHRPGYWSYIENGWVRSFKYTDPDNKQAGERSRYRTWRRERRKWERGQG